MQVKRVKSRTIWNWRSQAFPVWFVSWVVILESQAQSKLDLAWGVSAGCLHEVGRHLVVGREVVDSKLFSTVIEGGLIVHQAIVSDPIAGIQAIEQVEGLDGEFQAPAVFRVHLAGEADVGG